MMEGGWLLLAVVAMRSSAARPFAFLLLAGWWFTYFIIWMGDRLPLAYAWSVLFDAWCLAAAAVVYRITGPHGRFAWWRRGILAGWVASLAMQAAYWWALEIHGAWFGVEAFHAGRAIFTAQMAAVAWPGAYCLWLEARGLKGTARWRAKV